jgi:peroxiredoxin Q/BCP
MDEVTMMELLAVGDPAPGFCLQDMNGDDACLSSFRGRFVVLYFYPKDNTAACTLEAKDFSGEEEEFAALDVPVIGISPDSPESHRRFSEKHDLRVLLLSDPDHGVLEAYGVWQTKKLYGKEYKGVVRTTYIIAPDGTVAAVWPKVKVKGHVGEVRSALADLKAGKTKVSP